MTRERRLAIQMWEEISQQQSDSIATYKADFCREHGLDWKNSCWFCQYVRQDYRKELPSRRYIPCGYNRCQECPIYKYGHCTGDECGCEPDYKTSVFRQAIQACKVAYRQEAAEIIVRLLKGEKLWVTGEE